MEPSHSEISLGAVRPHRCRSAVTPVRRLRQSGDAYSLDINGLAVLCAREVASFLHKANPCQAVRRRSHATCRRRAATPGRALWRLQCNHLKLVRLRCHRRRLLDCHRRSGPSRSFNRTPPPTPTRSSGSASTATAASTVEQTGTEGYSQDGSVYYDAWYEMYPADDALCRHSDRQPRRRDDAAPSPVTASATLP